MKYLEIEKERTVRTRLRFLRYQEKFSDIAKKKQGRKGGRKPC